MVFGEVGQVVMSAALDPDQRDLARIYFLKAHTVFDRYQPVARAMYNIRMAVYMPYPFVGTQMITQHISYRQYGKKPFRHLPETIIWRIQYQIAWFIIRCQLCRKAAANASSIYNDMVFGNLFGER